MTMNKNKKNSSATPPNDSQSGQRAKLRFWGVRGSLPVGPSRYGSHTSCVEIELAEGVSVFFDGGTGILPALSQRSFRKIFLCLSHFHWDHIQGIPFIPRIDEPEFEMQLVTGFEDTWERLGVLFDPRFHPVAFDSIQRNIKLQYLKPGESLKIENFELSLAPLNHPGKSYAFRLQSRQTSFIYATDSDYLSISPEAEHLFQNGNFAVLDSQFLVGDSLSKAHYGHASFKRAIDVAARFGIGNSFLFHFDPNYTDKDLSALETQAKDYARDAYASTNTRVKMAVEGQTEEIWFD